MIAPPFSLCLVKSCFSYKRYTVFIPYTVIFRQSKTIYEKAIVFNNDNGIPMSDIAFTVKKNF